MENKLNVVYMQMMSEFYSLRPGGTKIFSLRFLKETAVLMQIRTENK